MRVWNLADTRFPARRMPAHRRPLAARAARTAAASCGGLAVLVVAAGLLTLIG